MDWFKGNLKLDPPPGKSWENPMGKPVIKRA